MVISNTVGNYSDMLSKSQIWLRLLFTLHTRFISGFKSSSSPFISDQVVHIFVISHLGAYGFTLAHHRHHHHHHQTSFFPSPLTVHVHLIQTNRFPCLLFLPHPVPFLFHLIFHHHTLQRLWCFCQPVSLKAICTLKMKFCTLSEFVCLCCPF